MFTGLIQQVGILRQTTPRGSGRRLVIAHAPWTPALAVGESIAVQGACLTVTEVRPTEFVCDVLRETLERTCLGAKKAGARLNLERAVRVGEALGGHLVSGHVDGTAVLQRRQQTGADWLLEFTAAPDLLRGMVVKGSVALDGVSLTITAVGPDVFGVQIIPYTWAHTTLHELAPGERVNVETDLIGKYVRRYLETAAEHGGLTLEHLRRAGFTA